MKILEKSTLLLLEDDIEFASSLTQTLKLYFKNVYHVATIEESITVHATYDIDVVMSDIHLKQENGLDFIVQLREQSKTIPIIIISGFNDKEYLMRAIKLGVVDYLLKPFDLREMESALASTVCVIEEKKNLVYQLTQEIYFDMDKKILYKNRQELPITAREYLFLELVIQRKGYILSREMIEEAVYQDETMSASALKNLLFRIRKKLGKDFIQTLPELGYKVHI